MTTVQTTPKVTIEAGNLKMEYDFSSMEFIIVQYDKEVVVDCNGGTFTLESFTQQMQVLAKGLKDRGY